MHSEIRGVRFFLPELQLAADAVIDMLCLGHCDVFLATAHSMFCIYPAKIARRGGRVATQLPRRNARTEHEGGVSFVALLFDEPEGPAAGPRRN